MEQQPKGAWAFESATRHHKRIVIAQVHKLPRIPADKREQAQLETKYRNLGVE